MRINHADLIEFQRSVGDFSSREMPKFLTWIAKVAEENPPAVLAVNPPNHVYDVEDGSLDLTIGRKSVELRLDHQRKTAGTVFSYRLLTTGSFLEVLRSIEELPTDLALEAAMAFYVESADGSFVCNSNEWAALEQRFGMLDEGLENPFYRGISEVLLEKLQEIVGRT